MNIKLSGIAAAVAFLCVAEAAGAQSPAPDVHVGDSWKFRTLDGFTNETQFEATQRVVEINGREIVVETAQLEQG